MFGNNPFSEFRATQQQVQENKFVIPEEIPANERTAFHGAAAAAAKAGKKSFNFGGKTHPVTMKKDTAKAIADQKEGYMKDLATADAKTDAEKAKVAADFKKRRKMKKDEKSDVEMNPKLDTAKDKGAAMETKESTIREKLWSVLEGADRAKHYKGATKPETMDDKLKGQGAKDMVNQPKEIDDTEEKGHKDAVKAGKTGPKAKARSGGDNTTSGDQKIVKGGTPMKNTQGVKSTMEAYALMYENYTHEFDYAEDGKNTAKSFVDKAKKAGIKAKIHSNDGPGGGHPVVHLGHKDTKKMHSFLKKHYDPGMEHDDLEAHEL